MVCFGSEREDVVNENQTLQREGKDMIVLVCLDKDNGMLFHNRRQSRDREVTARIQEICRGKKLWMNPYSETLYGKMDGVEIAVSDCPMQPAEKDDFCLVESDALRPFEEKVEGLMVFRWDKKYPADLYLDLDLSRWKRTKTREFSGYSHEIITEEVYVKGAGDDA